jgi:hypothetical protein
MVHMSMATTRTASRHAGAASASQYTASSAVRPSTCPSRPLAAGQVKEAGMPPVREHVLPGLLIKPPPGPAPAVLVDAQVRHRRGRLLQHQVSRGGERAVGGRLWSTGTAVRSSTYERV